MPCQQFSCSSTLVSRITSPQSPEIPCHESSCVLVLPSWESWRVKWSFGLNQIIRGEMKESGKMNGDLPFKTGSLFGSRNQQAKTKFHNWKLVRILLHRSVLTHLYLLGKVYHNTLDDLISCLSFWTFNVENESLAYPIFMWSLLLHFHHNHSVWKSQKSLIQHYERSELRLHFEWTEVN